MEKPPFKPLKYTCPICGKKAVFGTHHCEVPIEMEEPSSAPAPRLKFLFSAIVGIAVATALLWGMIGPYSLIFIALVPLGLALSWIIRRVQRRGREPL